MGDMTDVKCQQNGLTMNEDECSKFGDMKTEILLILKSYLDIFIYLVKEYKNDENKLNEIVKKFNKIFKTDFETKYTLNKNELPYATFIFGQSIIKSRYDINEIIKNAKMMIIENAKMKEKKKQLMRTAHTPNNIVKPVPVHVLMTGGEGEIDNKVYNDKLKEDTYKNNVIKLLQYLTFIDTLHDFHDSKKLKQIYTNTNDSSKQGLTKEIINDIKEGFYKENDNIDKEYYNKKENDYFCNKNKCYYLLLSDDQIEYMSKNLKIGEDANNIHCMIDFADKINTLKDEKFEKLLNEMKALWNIIYNRTGTLKYSQYEFEKYDNIKEYTLKNINILNFFILKLSEIINKEEIYNEPKEYHFLKTFKNSELDKEVKFLINDNHNKITVKNLSIKNTNDLLIEHTCNDTCRNPEKDTYGNYKRYEIEINKQVYYDMIFSNLHDILTKVDENNDKKAYNYITDALGGKNNTYDIISTKVKITKLFDIIQNNEDNTIKQYITNKLTNDENDETILNNIKMSNDNKYLETLTRIFDPAPNKPQSDEYKYSKCNKSIHLLNIGLKYGVQLRKGKKYNLENVDIIYPILPFIEEKLIHHNTTFIRTYKYTTEDTNHELSINTIYKILEKDCENKKKKKEKFCKKIMNWGLPNFILYGLKRSGDKGIIESAVKLCNIVPSPMSWMNKNIYERNRIVITNDGPALFYALLRRVSIIGISLKNDQTNANVIKIINTPESK